MTLEIPKDISKNTYYFRDTNVWSGNAELDDCEILARMAYHERFRKTKFSLAIGWILCTTYSTYPYIASLVTRLLYSLSENQNETSFPTYFLLKYIYYAIGLILVAGFSFVVYSAFEEFIGEYSFLIQTGTTRLKAIGKSFKRAEAYISWMLK